MIRPAFDWRPALIYTHRWLGIAGCALFVIWFASGIVMMYARMPNLSAEERLARSAPLDLTTARIEPSVAVTVAGFVPTTVRLGMLGSRPLYRLNAGSSWAAVYADTGEPLPPLSVDDAVAITRAFMPEHAGRLRYETALQDSDQWTLSSAIRPLMPLHRLALRDDSGTTLYVSARTAEPVMKTTRRERVWGYLGAVMHWLYFTPLRRHTELWVDLIVWLSISGSLMCLSGLVWGLWRYSPSSRYRLKRVPAHSPYAGMMKWHHYAGLLFGLTTCTWMFSGLMSMTPWNWSPGTTPTRTQLEVVTGGPMRVERLTLDAIRSGVATLSKSFTPKEVEIVQFQGEPFLVAYRPPESAEAREWQNTDLPAFVEPATLERRIVSLAAPERGAFTRFPLEAFERLAQRAVPGASAMETTWLTAYDAYYYDRSGNKSLPVLRARYDDPVGTWLYFDPSKGSVVHKEEQRSRLERWLYHGLHSLDFPFLYYRRPAWDIVLVVLSLGGLVSSVTSAVPAWRRLRAHGRAVFRRNA